MSHGKILCVSYDDTVSKYRRDALTKSGYEVVATTDVKAASRLLEEEDFDLLILGHRFSMQDKRDLILLAEKHQPLPVLLVCGASADAELHVDARVYALQGMEGLLDAVAKLVPVKAAV